MYVYYVSELLSQPQQCSLCTCVHRLCVSASVFHVMNMYWHYILRASTMGVTFFLSRRSRWIKKKWGSLGHFFPVQCQWRECELPLVWSWSCDRTDICDKTCCNCLCAFFFKGHAQRGVTPEMAPVEQKLSVRPCVCVSGWACQFGCVHGVDAVFICTTSKSTKTTTIICVQWQSLWQYVRSALRHRTLCNSMSVNAWMVTFLFQFVCLYAIETVTQKLWQFWKQYRFFPDAWHSCSLLTFVAPPICSVDIH